MLDNWIVFCFLTHLIHGHAQQRAKFPELAADMANAYGTMVCGAIAVPVIYKTAGANAETVAAVGIAYLQNGA
jgi:hypothetical protein